jgi:hypothetical protein
MMGDNGRQWVGVKHNAPAGLPVVHGVGKRRFELKTGDQNYVGRQAIEVDEKKTKGRR